MAIGRGEVGPEKREKCHVPYAMQLQALEHKTRVLCIPACVGVVDIEKRAGAMPPSSLRMQAWRKAGAACDSKIG
jgi:hypothetical protein